MMTEGSNNQNVRLFKKLRRPYEIWTPLDDTIILIILSEEVYKGSRLGNGQWRGDTWTRVLTEFKEKTGKEKGKDNILNCQKTWKKQYKRMANLLSSSGWAWNHVTKQIEVPEHVWIEFVQINKDVEHFRGQSCKNYELLHTVVGENTATESDIFMVGGKGDNNYNEHMHDVSVPRDNGLDAFVDLEDGNDAVPTSSSVGGSSSGSKQRRKDSNSNKGKKKG